MTRRPICGGRASVCRMDIRVEDSIGDGTEILKQRYVGLQLEQVVPEVSKCSQDCAPVCGVLCTVGLVSRRCAECGDYTGAGPGTQFGSARPPARSRHTDLVPGSDITLPVVVAPGRDHRAVHAQTQGVPGSRRHGQDAVPPAH